MAPNLAPRKRAPYAFLFLALSAVPALANGVTVTKHSKPAPADITAPVQAALAPGGATAKIGDTTIDFWWVK